ncbi:MAG: LysM peptidoglycan-binding domain-containing protein [Myxococcales bacterium]|nr:MAG: LysM peptidoglycan-binding domain-containing protein [Myxococcales bacterium]
MKTFRPTRICCLIAVLLFGATSLIGGNAHAEREHLVRSGQTLSSIARKYRISVGALAGANNIDQDHALRQGAVLRVPQPGIIYVQPGQSLSVIAKNHDVSVEKLAKANRIKANSTIKVGQRLVLPGHKAIARAVSKWGLPKNAGRITLYRVATKKRLRLRPLNQGGSVRPVARRLLANLLQERGSKKKHLPHPRLVRLLTQVSDHFGGRTIIVVSGYRRPGGYTSDESRHTKGRAIDFKVQGVSNQAVRDYLRSLSSVGVGYYPRSSFVHLDVRKKNAYWVDWSGPGQAPKIQRSGYPPPVLAGSNSEHDGHSEPQSNESAEVNDDDASDDEKVAPTQPNSSAQEASAPAST